MNQPYIIAVKEILCFLVVDHVEFLVEKRKINFRKKKKENKLKKK
jgi:hypothetical protein